MKSNQISLGQFEIAYFFMGTAMVRDKVLLWWAVGLYKVSSVF